MDLVFRDIEVSIKGELILKKLSGIAEKGEMLAIMGPSGAGKSTLLNALAGRIPISSGSITLNDEILDKRLGRKMRFVLQDDLFFPTLTLLETVTFAALLTLPEKMPRESKLQRVEDIIQLLELNKCKYTAMGNQYTPGLSGGERKRATIACEIITDPAVLLIDEPTSGLDYSIASNLIHTLKRYSQLRSKTIVASIHQPSSQMFHMFSNVLLMSDGQMVYFGQCSKILDHYQRVGLICKPQYNPADFIMEELRSSDENEKRLIEACQNHRQTDWPEKIREQHASVDIYQNRSKIGNSVTSMVNGQVNKAYEKSSSNDLPETDGKVENSEEKPRDIESGDFVQTDKVKNLTLSNGGQAGLVGTDEIVREHTNLRMKWQTGYWSQYRVLTQRLFIYNKHRIYSRINILHLLIVAVLQMALWFQLERTEKTLGDRNSFLFFTIVHWGFNILLGGLGTFEEERPVIQRERAAGLYRLSAYWMAKQTSELPLTLTMPIVCTFISYFAVGLTLNVWVFIGHTALILIFVLNVQALAMLLGVIIVDLNVRMATGDAALITLMLVGGFFHQNLPSYASWASYISPITHAYYGLLILEYRYGDNFKCLPDNSTAYEACLGNHGNRLTGDDVLDKMDINMPLWINFTVLTAMAIVFRYLSYLVLRYWRKPTTHN